MASASVRKAVFLGSLYLTQTIPNGYLKFLPVLMAERGDSMMLISTVALFSIGEFLKPLFGAFIDMNKVASPRARKGLIVIIQLSMMATFLLAMCFEKPELIQLAALFSFCSLLTAAHDTATDGLAVQILKEDEQALGGFGQYAGSKLGALIAGGITPMLVDTNHRLLCAGVLLPMIVVLWCTIQYDLSDFDSPITCIVPEAAPVNNQNFVLQSLAKCLHSIPPWREAIVYFSFKFADHGLDFLMSPMLVQAHISRATIVQTQLLLSIGAAVLGACVGSYICNYIKSAPKALAMCSALRLVPNLMQLWLAYAPVSSYSISFIAAHAVLENITGSAATGAAFVVLLQQSDPANPACSYAVLNTIAVIGSMVGQFSFGQLSHFGGFRVACVVGVLLNAIFPILSLAFLAQKKAEKRE
eukprot:gene24485-27693_t